MAQPKCTASNFDSTTSNVPQSVDFTSPSSANLFNYQPQQWNTQMWNPSSIHPTSSAQSMASPANYWSTISPQVRSTVQQLASQNPGLVCANARAFLAQKRLEKQQSAPVSSAVPVSSHAFNVQAQNIATTKAQSASKHSAGIHPIPAQATKEQPKSTHFPFGIFPPSLTSGNNQSTCAASSATPSTSYSCSMAQATVKKEYHPKSILVTSKVPASQIQSTNVASSIKTPLVTYSCPKAQLQVKKDPKSTATPPKTPSPSKAANIACSRAAKSDKTSPIKYSYPVAQLKAMNPLPKTITITSAAPKSTGCSSKVQPTPSAPPQATNQYPQWLLPYLYHSSPFKPYSETAHPPTSFVESPYPAHQNVIARPAVSQAHQAPENLHLANSNMSLNTISSVTSSSSGISLSNQTATSASKDTESSQSVLRTSPLIDYDTPEVIARMILNAIAITPYDLEDDTRTPELFVDQFETYSNLLNLTVEQKRVLFAGLAYQDDASCFEAIKFDITYEEMTINFIDWAWRMHLRSPQVADLLQGKPVKKPGMMRRLLKFLSKFSKKF